jgi:hypothetical protein
MDIASSGLVPVVGVSAQRDASASSKIALMPREAVERPHLTDEVPHEHAALEITAATARRRSRPCSTSTRPWPSGCARSSQNARLTCEAGKPRQVPVPPRRVVTTRGSPGVRLAVDAVRRRL